MSLNLPMTTQQAEERYACNCDDEDMCRCLLDATCSFPCPKCVERIWLPDSGHKVGNRSGLDCPYCDEEFIRVPFPEVHYQKGRYEK